MVSYTQISQKSAPVFSFKGRLALSFSSRIHINRRPGTHEPATWPFIKSERPNGLIQGEAFAGSGAPGPRPAPGSGPGAPLGSACLALPGRYPSLAPAGCSPATEGSRGRPRAAARPAVQTGQCATLGVPRVAAGLLGRRAVEGSQVPGASFHVSSLRRQSARAAAAAARRPVPARSCARPQPVLPASGHAAGRLSSAPTEAASRPTPNK